jgi:hypothetical protein
MDEYTADSFVNRDEPIPIITFDQHDYVSGDDDSNGEEGRRNRIKSTSRKLKEMVQQSKGKASEGRRSMQDRLMEKYCFSIDMVLAATDKMQANAATHTH